MAREYRVDRAELRPPQKRADGSVRYDAGVSRVGVFPYRKADGTIRLEYRSAEEVGRTDSLATLELIPITDGHPPKAGMAKKAAIGSTGDNVKFDGSLATTSLAILDDDANARVDRGELREVSPGYTVDLVEKPGVTPWGERYDAEQTNIVYEHIALVPRGRQGSTVALRADEADAWRADAAVQVSTWGHVTAAVTSSSLSQDEIERAVKAAIEATPGLFLRTDAAERKDVAGVEVVAGWADAKGAASCTVTTRELSLDDLLTKLKAGLASVDVTVGDPAAATPPRTDRADAAGHMEPVMKELQEKLAAALADLAAATARADAAEAKAKTEAARADKAEGERDTHKDRADKAERERTDAIAAAPNQVRARLKLEADAAAVLGAEFKLDGLDDTAIKAAVVAKLTGKELPADKAKNPDYVAGRYDTALEALVEAAAAGGALREAVVPKPGERTDAPPTESDAARAMRERNKALSQNTQPGSN